MKIAIIDLGTNTFNLLIVETGQTNSFQTLLNTKAAVMLGHEGINEGYISDKAFTRAYGVLRDFHQLLVEFKCDKTLAFGTSAIRTARNSDNFINKIYHDLNIKIEPITGDKEAEYIYYGVNEAVEFTQHNYLILDIGGGSNEFIIANNNGLIWKHSFKLGGARLLDKFKPEDPILESEIELINHYLEVELQLLKEAIREYPVKKLVGSSGAFDSFAEIDCFKKTGLPLSKAQKSYELTIEDFKSLYDSLVRSNRIDRLAIQGLDPVRIDTIVMAAIFTYFVIKLINAESVIQSSYALKEGVVVQLEKNN